MSVFSPVDFRYSPVDYPERILGFCAFSPVDFRYSPVDYPERIIGFS